jgi:outer membrane biosynthesis protein TonB
MPSELNRRALLAALAAFVLALAVAYGLGSTGQASEGAGTPGAPAKPLDVASGVAGQSALGDAAGLPPLAVRPAPPEPEAEPEEEEEPAAPPPSAPVYDPPDPVVESPPVEQPTPTPEPEPAPPAPEVEFDDSG